MNVPYPLAYPAPTAFYLTLYVLTFALHHAFMHYVLAGSLYVTWTNLFPGRGAVSRAQQPVGATLRDWLPFMLSAAITAGVAPLLFVQIVYQKQFYTANLLLWWRWMIVVPVLIVAFYLSYLLKSKRLQKWPWWSQVAVAAAMAGSFVFVGFCWTANYLLSVAEARWPEVYVTGQLPFSMEIVLPRMLIWISDSFTTMAVVVAWQLYLRQSLRMAEDTSAATRKLALLGWGGLAVVVPSSLVYLMAAGAGTRAAVFQLGVMPYVVLGVLGVVLQIAGWIAQWVPGRLTASGMSLISAGSASTLLGLSFVREAIRTDVVDMSRLFDRHQQAAQVGGFGVFLAFTVLVSAAIGWCFVTVQRGLRSRAEQDQMLSGHQAAGTDTATS